MANDVVREAPHVAGRAADVQALLDRIRAFGLPGGERAARGVRAVKLRERGEIRSAPGARWISFTAEEVIESGRSAFCWEARLQTGPLRALTVTDAYEQGHGRLVVRLGGIVPVEKVEGPEADEGELQRYLGQIASCPPILLNHPSLEWEAIGAQALRVRDREGPAGVSVDLDVGDDGRLLGCHAVRPRLVGRRPVPTPWSGTCADPREWRGLRVPGRLEATWHLAEGTFNYYWSETTSLDVVH